MDFFLGFCPDTENVPKIKKVVSEVSHVFNDLGVPVRWLDSNNYCFHLLSLGKTLPFFRYYWIKYRLKTFVFKPFKVKMGTVKLGLNRKYKELIYLDLKEGGEEMRSLLQNLRKLLGVKDDGNFIPHLVLGRVSKDLSPQEYLNISKDIYRVAKHIDIDKIEFYISSLSIIKHSSAGFVILLELGRSH